MKKIIRLICLVAVLSMCSCFGNELTTETLIVKKIGKDKFNADYVEFSNLDGSRNDYWMKGERYCNSFPYKVGDVVVIVHEYHYNNTTKSMKKK